MMQKISNQRHQHPIQNIGGNPLPPNDASDLSFEEPDN